MSDRLRLKSPLIFLILLGALTFWLDRVTRPPEQIKDSDLNRNPDYIVENLSGIRMDYAREIERKFTAEKLFYYLDEKVTELEHINFTNTEPEKPLIRMFADRAVVKSKGQDIYLMGNVTAVRGMDGEKSKITLTTNFLHLIPDESLIKTDQPVTISRFNTIVNANGLEFNNRIGMIELLSDVRAVNKKSNR
ncbi:LPS export ABC transporter periplasmic protein LptC [Nitrosomonas sp.]|uniref:LPS export ABC transporter periplasmic protein LptC n=1 Tax=Nitrosomonas sp. TaxID=42353 RepID=UPI0025E64949|nr:LPS export ABC transporter periplasmic protein LptC [Nitrosomonas sp.]MBS0587689.1 LPS export ABC transporter periplasmic protein LptC [Pseudomonadota bacterium]MBV6448024.1 Lipopolysaccharide export system protein LptC [Nitrosomonas sp.]